jgi:DNA-binding beta-propeller fold protein YncE
MNGGDLTRSTFRASRRFSGVRMQQGRVQLDADWNEQVDVQAHRSRTEVLDVVGAAGAPRAAAGFGLEPSPDGSDLLLTPGRAWVGGHLCELAASDAGAVGVGAAEVRVTTLVLDDAELRPHDWLELTDDAGVSLVTRVLSVDTDSCSLTLADPIDALTGDLLIRRRTSYTTQPDLPDPEGTVRASATDPRVLSLSDGTYLLMLDVWERTITVHDDPSLADPALGVDTTTRSKVVWQVRLLDVPAEAGPIDCGTDVGAAVTSLTPSTARMFARADPAQVDGDLCRPTPAGGYSGLENHLYRVHVHDLDGDRPVVLWSRENASVVTRWLGNVSDDLLEVASIGPDAVLGFGPGDWVELYDDTTVLHRRPGTLVQMVSATGNRLRLDLSTATGPTRITDFPLNPQVRRWDSEGTTTALDGSWIPLENGVEVAFPLGGRFRRHDYWLVPARSSHADVDWPRDSVGRPLPELPDGVAHSTARLALLTVAAGGLVVRDCREVYPTLTDLRAVDVAVSDAACGLGVSTVQEALDALCRANDLRRHLRLLHGYGIVHGLAVHCGDRTMEPVPEDAPPRRLVTVQPGVAVDGEGNDLDVPDPLALDVLAALEAAGLDVLDENGDGEVSLALRTGEGLAPELVLQPFVPRDEADLLEGTLLKDVYDDCIARLWAWVRAQLDPAGGPEQNQSAYQLRTALTNLASYPANPKSGSVVFVGSSEHKLLVTFYEGLRKRLRSETYCAMFDDARPYPDYPRSLSGIRTIAGPGLHNTVRVHPAGREAYTVGAGLNPAQPTSLINRYDLDAGTLISRLDPVSGKVIEPGDDGSSATASVTDVAFSPDGRRIYVTVPTRDGNDTLFRQGDIDGGGGVRWRPASTICGVKLVTLATTAADPEHLYAVGLRRVARSGGRWKPREFAGAGLFRINPDEVPEDLQPMPGTAELNTIGHLVISATGVAVLTCGEPGALATAYNRLQVITLPSGALGRQTGVEEGRDTFALLAGGRVSRTTVAWVVVGQGTDRGLVGYDIARGVQLTDRFLIPESSGTISAHSLSGRVVLTDSNTSAVQVFAPESGFIDALRLPVQLGPISIAAAETRPAHVVVMNRLSSSLSVIDAELVTLDAFDVEPLVTYRRAAVEAFADLVGGFLQYLKDCLCEHLLVKEPQRPDARDLDLAVISLRAGSVHKVCNWSRRRYVKSFPTVGYWLSIVPIIPAVREAVGRLCCSLLTDYTSTFSTADDDRARDRVETDAILRLLEIAQQEDPWSRVRQTEGTVRSAGSLALQGQLSEASVRLSGLTETSRTRVRSDGEKLARLMSRIESLEGEVGSLKADLHREQQLPPGEPTTGEEES